MRIYFDENKNELSAVICNKCKKELKVEKGILKEGCFSGNVRFGYFSNKDGSKHSGRRGGNNGITLRRHGWGMA